MAFVAVAPAKLNLFLEIVKRRLDGFHELETIMIAVDLFDTLEFSLPVDAPVQATRNVSLTTNDNTIPTDERNLVTRAAVNWNNSVSIHLTKRIPNQAGMGGGSSDAATTLKSMQKLFGLASQPIQVLGDQLGSDVGFFVDDHPAAICTGRGEIVKPLEIKGPFHFVVVKPNVGCPTAEVYKRVKLPDQTLSSVLVRNGLATGDLEQMAKGLWNRLQNPAFDVALDVRRVYDGLLKTRPLAVQVTGSGSAVFALARDRKDAMRIAEEYDHGGCPDQRFVLRSLQTIPELSWHGSHP